MNLPQGWTEAYTIRWAYEEIQRLTSRVGYLENEVNRLQETKANRAGRKPTVGRQQLPTE